MAMFTYHRTFIPVPEELLMQLCTSVYTFVAANGPVVAGTARLYPLGNRVYMCALEGWGIDCVATPFRPLSSRNGRC